MIELLERLYTYPPFSLLPNETRETIEKNTQIAYYPESSVLIEIDTFPEYLFFIIKGVVEVKEGDTLIDIYHEDDTFGGSELIEGQPARADYIVTEELICYLLPKEIFLELCNTYGVFKNYYFSSIVERIETIKERKELAKMADLMVARIEESMLHAPCVVPFDMPVIKALQKMESENAVALLVKQDNGYGIVTDSDLRRYILHKDEESLESIGDIQTFPVVSAQQGDLLFNVLLLMTGRSIKHLPVTDLEGKPIGVLTLIDLLSLFSNQSHLIGHQIDRATDIAQVIDAVRRIDIMISALHMKGVKARYIARLVSELHKKMYAKLFALIFPASWHTQCVLILMGSEGRGEQILRTDQDNGIIFEEGFDPEGKEALLLRFTEALDAIGFPRCQGNVMVINPKWAKSQNAYRDDIRRWVGDASGDDLMDLAIFYDAFAVAGNVQIFTTLRDEMIRTVSVHSAFLPRFAAPIEQFESPLGLFSRFVTFDKGHKNEIDVKKSALFALIHGIRSLSLEYGITKNNTTQRIKMLRTYGYFQEDEAIELIEALEVLMNFRLHARLKKMEQGKEPDNYIDLESLGKLEKDTLKEALKIVDKFKKRVAYHFHLSVMG